MRQFNLIDIYSKHYAGTYGLQGLSHKIKSRSLSQLVDKPWVAEAVQHLGGVDFNKSYTSDTVR
jgi:acetate kinase